MTGTRSDGGPRRHPRAVSTADGQGISAGKSSLTHKRYAAHRAPVQRQATGNRADANPAPASDPAAIDRGFTTAIRPDLAELASDPGESRGQDAYPGAYESLGRDGAAMLDDAELQAGMHGARRELAAPDPASPEYQDRRHNLTVLEWEADQRGLSESGVLPASHGRVGPDSVVLFDDPVHCRFVLERQIAAAGIEGARDFVRRFQMMSGDGPRPAGPADVSAHDGAIATALDRALEVLEAENARFEVEFEKRALTLAGQILDHSEQRVCAEMARYGMRVDRAWGLAGARADHNGDTRAMQSAAHTLLESSRRLETLRRQRGSAAWNAAQPDAEQAVDDDLDADTDGMGGGGEFTPDELTALAQLDARIDAAEFDHAQLRTELEAEHPALARYQSTEQLERVTQDEFGARQVAWDLDGNLLDIARTRAALGDDLGVFRLPQVVRMTERQMMVRPGSP